MRVQTGTRFTLQMCSKGSVILERETDEGDECYVPELGGEAVRDLPGNAELVAR